MGYKFNPFTGTLDYFESSDAALNFKKSYTVVDNSFLNDRTVTLESMPVENSEFVFFNGLLITDDCYTINNNELSFPPTLGMKEGYLIDIRYLI